MYEKKKSDYLYFFISWKQEFLGLRGRQPARPLRVEFYEEHVGRMRPAVVLSRSIKMYEDSRRREEIDTRAEQRDFDTSEI